MKALTFLEFYTQLCEKYGEDALYDVRKLNALAKYNKLVSQPFNITDIPKIFNDLKDGYSKHSVTSNIKKVSICRLSEKNISIRNSNPNINNCLLFSMPINYDIFISYCNALDIQLEFTPETIKEFGLDKL